VPEEEIELTESLRVDASHPCLPGHFPGQAIVPGVVLLDRVAALLERAGLGTIQRMASIKFRAPLLPGQVAELHISVNERRLRFRIARDEQLLASGEGELA
jgi:3-hydroxymyristoyl/3-hydroxydecanoyl-(acyl carrier protein) dehydratase